MWTLWYKADKVTNTEFYACIHELSHQISQMQSNTDPPFIFFKTFSMPFPSLFKIRQKNKNKHMNKTKQTKNQKLTHTGIEE